MAKTNCPGFAAGAFSLDGARGVLRSTRGRGSASPVVYANFAPGITGSFFVPSIRPRDSAGRPSAVRSDRGSLILARSRKPRCFAPRAHRGIRISRGGTSAPVFAGAIFLGATPMMLKIACQQCGHVGIISVATLPRELRCWQCGASRYVEAKDGARITNRAAVLEWLLVAPGSPRVTERKL